MAFSTELCIPNGIRIAAIKRYLHNFVIGGEVETSLHHGAMRFFDCAQNILLLPSHFPFFAAQGVDDIITVQPGVSPHACAVLITRIKQRTGQQVIITCLQIAFQSNVNAVVFPLSVVDQCGKHLQEIEVVDSLVEFQIFKLSLLTKTASLRKEWGDPLKT